MNAPREPDSASELFTLFNRLTRPLPWRLHVRPFPVVVIEPGTIAVDESAYMAALHKCAEKLNLTHQYVELSENGEQGGESRNPRSRACTLLDRLTQNIHWVAESPHYGAFRFPRSDLVRTLEEAAAAARGHASDSQDMSAVAVTAWNRQASLFPRRNRSANVFAQGATVAAFVMAVAGGIIGGFAGQNNWIALAITGILFGLLFLTAALPARGVWLPVLSRVGFGGRYRWLATSSLIRILGDGSGGAQGRTGFEGRLYEVLRRLTTSAPHDFLLRIKTLAFLEDMRANHRRLSPDLRGFKRSAPPVLFLKGVTEKNGGIDLLAALSDIRSQRSEMHPLLVIASADSAHRGELPGPSPTPERKSLLGIYGGWRAALGTLQPPSSHVPLPWLLRLPVQPGDAASIPSRPATPRRRPRWTWAWSRRGLFAGVAALAIIAGMVQASLRLDYCNVGITFDWSTDTRLHRHPDGFKECAGVATGKVRFERGRPSVGIDSEVRPPSPGNTGSRLTLADLQNKINKENERVRKSRKPYVTVLHAGAFTARQGEHDRAVSSIRELAGAHLAQVRNNGRQHPGQVGNFLQVRLLPVNTGQDMGLAGIAADRMLDLARRDPTVIGVVGLARNTAHTQRAIRRLHDAGLPVLGTANSSDRLPALPHYYSLASTSLEQATAAKAAAREKSGTRPIERIMIVSRASDPSDDAYGPELASGVLEALRPRHVDSVPYLSSNDISDKVRNACAGADSSPYTLVYFAGRAEDLWGFMHGLALGGCTDRELTVVAGDDVTKYQFGTGPYQVALHPKITFYHTAFAHLPHLIANSRATISSFFLLARNPAFLGLGNGATIQGADPVLVDGHMALAFDATSALIQAAQNSFNVLGLNRPDPAQIPGSRSVTSGSVRLALPHVTVPDGATGKVDLTRETHSRAGPGNRGLTLVKITAQDGRVKSEPVCGRLSGGGASAPGLDPCPRPPLSGTG
ncbi:hypothetical protein [Actinomadura rugatobispora]|uniref:ABC transporter substrate-binding protein n=1 Tax=Actinomadura rugatobispora TaxID=1994 RepID=A0ABW0ZTS5_9ACTN|nr:hypothetical protein GCM10010200_076390 [Actinomadura rugatobispora]